MAGGGWDSVSPFSAVTDWTQRRKSVNCSTSDTETVLGWLTEPQVKGHEAKESVCQTQSTTLYHIGGANRGIPNSGGGRNVSVGHQVTSRFTLAGKSVSS